MTLGGALLLALVLGVFAYVILDSQANDRDDVENRFNDVADVSANVVNGIFELSLSSSAERAATRFGGPTVRPAVLEAFAAQSDLAYAAVYDGTGKRIAATSEAPAESVKIEVVDMAIDSGEPYFGNVVDRDGRKVIESAVPYPAASGERVYVSATKLDAFSQFLAGTFERLETFDGTESLMVDGNGVVLGGANLSTPVGETLEDDELIEKLGDEDAGEYGDSRYFASEPIVSSPLKVVLDTSQDDLYDEIGGSRKTVPWILFGAFALVALLGLYLLRRAATASAELAKRSLNERHAVEINDNIIQGLALAKYQLQAGEGEASAQQVSETLREAQRLVSNLLGEAEVQAGQLRREVAAETTRPEDKPPK